MRIVSLLGSATEIVFELGLQRFLVGISHECDHPAEVLGLPRVSQPRFDARGLSSGEIDAAVRRSMEVYGSVYEIDRKLLHELRPTVVLTQAVCEVCAVPAGSVQAAVASLPRDVQVVSLDAHSLEEIFGTIRQVADAVGMPGHGDATLAGLRQRLERVRSRLAGAQEPAVLLLEWLDPPFAPGHWVPEMVGWAGGRNLIGGAGAPSRPVTWADLSAREPDVLLVEPCGYGLDEAAADADRHGARLASIASHAIRSGRAWLLHSAWFSRSGPRVVAGIEVLARLIHPDWFPEIPLEGRARAWRCDVQ